MIYQGYWFLPGNTNASIQGTLRLTSESIELVIVGQESHVLQVFPELDIRKTPFHDLKVMPIVHGLAKSEENEDVNITLSNCDVSSYNWMELGRISFEIEYVFISQQREWISELSFQSAFVKFGSVDQWTGIFGFNVENGEFGQRLNTSISYQQPEPFEIFEDNRMRVYLYFRAKSPAFAIYKSDATIRQETFLNIEFKRKLGIKTIVKTIQNFQDFFSFSMSTIAERQITQIGKHSSRKAKSIGTKIPTFDVFFIDHSKETRKFNSQFALIRIDDVKTNMTEMLGAWLKLYKKNPFVMKLYFEVAYSRNLSIRSCFLNYVIVLESYHTNVINSDRKYYFKNRIIELVKRHRPITKLMISNPKSFATRIADARNKLAHGLSRIPERYIDDGVLSDHSSTLRILIQCCLLYELGFENDEILRMVKRPASNWQKLNHI